MTEESGSAAPSAHDLLQEILVYCRQIGLAESTFGRLAVNDGKFAARLRNGGRITTETLERVRTYIARHHEVPPRLAVVTRARGLRSAIAPRIAATASPPVAPRLDDPQRNFRFFDNRQKYLLFVNTCSEKWVIASRVALELANIHPRPPAVRMFDAGIGDGTVLARVMRALHDQIGRA